MRIDQPDQAQIPELLQMWKDAFGEYGGFWEMFLRTAFLQEHCRCVTVDGQAAAALYWFDGSCGGQKTAYIYAVVTRPEYRGKGLCRVLLEDTHAHLKAQGYAGAVLKPASGLFPFYTRLGYVTSGYISRFTASAGSVPIHLKDLSSKEYGLLRKTYLPENGIVQEGITLNYLRTFAKFYACEDAIVCTSREEPVIFEYLGNPHSAPGILAALGIQSAEIPTVGNDIPFAMFYPLNCTKIPGYLGISLE